MTHRAAFGKPHGISDTRGTVNGNQHPQCGPAS